MAENLIAYIGNGKLASNLKNVGVARAIIHDKGLRAIVIRLDIGRPRAEVERVRRAFPLDEPSGAILARPGAPIPAWAYESGLVAG